MRDHSSRLDRLGRPVVFLIACLLACGGVLTLSAAEPDWQQQASEHEFSGDLQSARTLLQRAAVPGDAKAYAALASFSLRHQEPDTRSVLLKWAGTEPDSSRRLIALRQAVLIDLETGNRSALDEDLKQYRAAGGTDFTSPGAAPKPAQRYAIYPLPGPLPAFARMAALAPEVDPEDLLPALARNLVTSGYVASGNEMLEQTEYLKLINRYLAEARELLAFATGAHKIVVPSCDSEQTGTLLKILGYRMRGSCGSDIALETVNPSRAFLTIDSGFPIAQLERDLRANHRFELDYGSTPIPVLYDTAFWVRAAGRENADFLDLFLTDPSLCRLYLGMSHLDSTTFEVIRTQIPLDKLRIAAGVLDFYGGMFQIRNGSAVVPGSPKAWSNLVGVSPSNPARFYEKILTTDDGWLGGYFDALLRLDDPAVTAYLTTPERLHRFYEALRGRITSPGPARPVFRATTDLMLLTSGLRIEPDGKVHIPGNLEVWRNLVAHHPKRRFDTKLSRAAANWHDGDDLLEALFALSRKNISDEPIRLFLTLNDIDRTRAHALSPGMVDRLISNFGQYGAQYRIFADAPHLTEQSMNLFLDMCSSLNDIHDQLLRVDAIGSAQAMIEIWSILARRDLMPAEALNSSLAAIANGFAGVHQSSDLFTATRISLDKLLAAAGAEPGAGSREQRLWTLLVGNIRGLSEGLPSPAERFAREFDAQELVSIDVLLAVNERVGQGSIDPKLANAVNQQLDRLRETETLHESLSMDEKSAALGNAYWAGRHLSVEQKLDLQAVVKNSDKKEGHAALASMLRDSLVGTVYCYYAPPGAQILTTNPLFVRNHDFAGAAGSPGFWGPTDVSSAGWPSNEGGRLSGSLISLPFALALAEQNFMSPKRPQALIWGDLAPQVIMGVTVTGWHNISPQQVRWVALRVRRGEDLLAEAALDPALQARVLTAVSRFLAPVDVERITRSLNSGNFGRAAFQVPPSVFYAISEDAELQNAAPDLPSLELASWASANSPELSDSAIAAAFGTPKPTLTHSYRPSLRNVRTFPALMGYSSRILAETWESNNIYYALLADEAGVPAAQLDTYVPEWNRTSIESIFAANLEDWPALIRSLHSTADVVLHRGPQQNEQQAAATFPAR